MSTHGLLTSISESKKRDRCVHFSGEEKLYIANVCAKYGNILENKKTDHLSSEEKNNTWNKIAVEVNSAAIGTTYRSPDILKRFYENRKREVRKLAAQEKKELFKTGGGQSTKLKKEACHDVILSIMNPKTVYGLENNFDSDAQDLAGCSSSNGPQTEAEFEIIYEFSNTDSVDVFNEGEQNKNITEIISENASEKNNRPAKEEQFQSKHLWKNYTPTDLKRPITSSLLNFENQSEPFSAKRKLNTVPEDNKTPNSKHRQNLSSSRRRPCTNIKALTRSELAEKYDILLDKRIQIADYQKKKTQADLDFIENERKLKLELLQLQIAVEKEKLKNQNNINT